jgi:hypothetical protein
MITNVNRTINERKKAGRSQPKGGEERRKKTKRAEG